LLIDYWFLGLYQQSFITNHKPSGFDPALLRLPSSCATKIIDGSDLEARENPKRIQTTKKETKTGETLRCVISVAKATF
jgi:hypothetical protein